LAAAVAEIPGVTIAYPVEANGVFAALPHGVAEELQRQYPFYVWDPPSGVVRWMTSFDTTAEDVDEFAALVARLMADHQP
jgi:threonine aldolase